MHRLGVSSGERLIAEVADASGNQLPVGEKRRLVGESEFAQVMKVLAWPARATLFRR